YRIYVSSQQRSGGWASTIYNPSTWQFQGSNDGASWTTLHSVSNASISQNQWLEYAFPNTSSYRHYRLNITTGQASPWVHVTEIQLLGPGPVCTGRTGTIALSYDADDLLTAVDGMTLSRAPQNGLLTGTSFGVVADSISYSPFGEVTGYVAQSAGSPV